MAVRPEAGDYPIVNISDGEALIGARMNNKYLHPAPIPLHLSTIWFSMASLQGFKA